MPRLTEHEVIAKFFAPIAGPAGLNLADDAAVITPPAGHDLVVSTDMLAASVDFFPDDPADAVAKKALRVNLSDLAGKAAAPLGFLLSLALPQDWTEGWLAAFAQGLGEDAELYGCPLIGGDTMQSPNGLIVSIAALGTVPKGEMVPRGGAAEGDILFVSGTIGDAALGLRLRREEETDRAWIAALDAGAGAHLLQRYQLPQPRLALGQALRAHAHAALDVSDGLAGDLAKMLRLTGVTAVIDLADVPLSKAARQALSANPALAATVLSGGDDYEVICAVAPEEAHAFESAANAAGVAVTRLGRTQAGASNPVFKDARGPIDLPTLAYEHF